MKGNGQFKMDIGVWEAFMVLEQKETEVKEKHYL